MNTTIIRLEEIEVNLQKMLDEIRRLRRELVTEGRH